MDAVRHAGWLRGQEARLPEVICSRAGPGWPALRARTDYQQRPPGLCQQHL